MGGAHDEEAAAGTPGLVPAVVVKGKRSKRQRVHALPVVLTAATAEWSSSAASATAAAPHGEEDSSGTSPSSDEAASTGGCVTVTTEEEEDMALCLVLLSRGEPAKGAVVNKEASRVRSRRPAAGVDGAGEVVYECKTCNRCFPSFQALGGHRTSHKKPRLLLPPEAASEDNNNGNHPATALVDTTTTPPPPPHASFVPPPPPEGNTADETVLLAIPLAVAPAVPPKQEQPPVAATASAAGSSSSTKHPRVHECSICGAEFASGQALGGHMRRHRPLVPAAARDDITASSHAPARIKVKSLLELDLNMPAPCDEAVTSPRFAPFAAERQPVAAPPMLFPAALVDCHY